MKSPGDALIARVRGQSVVWRGVLLAVAAVLCLMVFGRMNRRARVHVAGTPEEYQQSQPGENEQELNPKGLIGDEKQKDWADSFAGHSHDGCGTRCEHGTIRSGVAGDSPLGRRES